MNMGLIERGLIMKKKITWKNIIILQAVIIIYTVSSVVAKFATGKELFSFSFFLFYGIEIMVLGVYALLWQQMIKKFDLSIAYANRAMALLWSALWAVILFKDSLSVKQIIGILIVIAGTIVVNSDKKQEVEAND